MSESSSGKSRRAVENSPGVDGELPVEALRALSDVMREATLEVLWRQWAAVGGTVSARRRAASLVDPEALVLTSVALQSSEPRLTDVVGDWVFRNSDLLSVQRIRNLAAAYPEEVRSGLRGVARIALTEGRDHRWKVFTVEPANPAGELTRRLNKRRAVRVRVEEPAALMLRLRLAIGVGIKADVLTLLLTQEFGEWASVSGIAHATGYTVAAVRKAISDLAEARVIDAIAGTRAEYRARRHPWQGLLGVTAFPVWRDWHDRFLFATTFLAWVEEAEHRPLTSYVVASRGRDLVEAHPNAFHWSGDGDEEWSGKVVAAAGNPLLPAVGRLAGWMEENA
jgi:hypothetical protein